MKQAYGSVYLFFFLLKNQNINIMTSAFLFSYYFYINEYLYINFLFDYIRFAEFSKLINLFFYYLI
jgi:hypothetical protein